MSSNIRINKVCEYCQQDFEARKTTSKTCSDYCAKRYYKQRKKTEKTEAANTQTLKVKLQPLEQIKAKEFLTVKDVSLLLNCSIRTAYNLIEKGNIKAVNLSERKTLIKRSDIDNLFI